MQLKSFADVSLAAGADTLSKVFAGYAVALEFTAERLALHVAYNDVDVRASPIWFDGAGNAIAAALIAFRGDRAWVGGFGVAPEYRRRGHAAALLESLIGAARERRCSGITLEVLRSNDPAQALYANAGFIAVRRLFSFRVSQPQNAVRSNFRYVDPDDFVDLPRACAPCWQRENAGIRNGAASSALSDAAGTYALFRYNDALAQVVALQAQSSETLCELMDAIAAGAGVATVAIFNEPQESALLEMAQQAGWKPDLVQDEMRLSL